MRILIAAGGTGGHIYPALAVLRSLADREKDLEIRWVGGHRGLEAGIVPTAGYELDRLWLRSLRSVDLSVNTIIEPLRLAASLPQATALLARFRPRAIFTTGGYVAIPILAAASAGRIPSLMWEGNRVAGRSVRTTARLASAIAVSFEATCEGLPGPCFVTGTPIRSMAGIDRAEARARLKLDADLPVLLIFGGSQAVRRLNDAVAEALPRLLERMSVLHLTGETSYAEALRRREALPAERRGRYRPFPFLRDEMGDALVAADLLVGRAGSSTLAEATAVGLPMVVVPYPYAASHQLANAQHLVSAGAATLVADQDFDGAALLAASEIVSDQPRRAAMALASRGMGRPGASRAVAELVLALAKRQEMPSADRILRLTREVA